MEQYVIYVLLFFIYAFLGWTMEFAITLWNEHKYVNRGFLVGPLCPIYGYSVLLMTIFLGKYEQDIAALFIMAVVICSLVEYVTSFVLEKVFKARWWDYSHLPFHLNGRICLLNSIGFGVLGTLVIKWINPFFVFLLSHIPSVVLLIIAIVFVVLHIVDIIVTTTVMTKIKKKIKVASDSDNTAEITETVKDFLLEHSSITRHILHAYKNMQVFIKDQKKRNWRLFKKQNS